MVVEARVVRGAAGQVLVEADHRRAQQRLVAVTLFDTKPWQLPPTIDEELFVGNVSGKVADATTLTPTQIDSFLEAQDAVAV